MTRPSGTSTLRHNACSDRNRISFSSVFCFSLFALVLSAISDFAAKRSTNLFVVVVVVLVVVVVVVDHHFRWARFTEFSITKMGCHRER